MNLIHNTLPLGCIPACRGCEHRLFSREQSEKQKRRYLVQLFGENAVGEVHGTDQPWGYREKVCLHARWVKDRWIFGLLGARTGPHKRDREILDLRDCPIHSQRVRKITQALTHAFPADSPLVFLAISGTLVTFVFKSGVQPPLPEVSWAELGVSGVWINLNPSAGNRVFANRGWTHVWGKPYGEQDGMRYGPDSFRQAGSALHQKALNATERFLAPTPEDAVLDLCSGTGESLKLWKKLGARFLGVELGGDSVNHARWNLQMDACLRGRVSERIPQMDEWIRDKTSGRLLVYANPPRTGLEESVVKWLAEVSRPDKIAYLSCSPGSLKRDLTVLMNSGYVLERLVPFDFFPKTRHIETLALLNSP